MSAWCLTGLSPRVRGNPGEVGHQVHYRGSIPASAGQPGLRRSPCGATGAPSSSRHRRRGLSPRVRGNHPKICLCRGVLGSIPASAGQPFNVVFILYPNAVYPRECGATGFTKQTTWSTPGLSPRVRGNRSSDIKCVSIGRSIPASAGQPSSCGLPRTGKRVYPRECGATEVFAFVAV